MLASRRTARARLYQRWGASVRPDGPTQTQRNSGLVLNEVGLDHVAQPDTRLLAATLRITFANDPGFADYDRSARATVNAAA